MDTYDLIIIGGGPAGTAAGVYAARKQLKTLMFAEEIGGQSTVSPAIQNWIGTVSIGGTELAESFKAHLEAYAGDVVTIADERVRNITKNGATYTVTTTNEKTYATRAMLITTGATRRRLMVPGADEFEHKGLTYCATCDGPLFAGQDVAVIGGGNAGFETAAQLLSYAKSVTLLQRGERYRADEVTVQSTLAHPNMRGLLNTEIVRVEGEKFVNGLTYRVAGETEEITLPVTGIFVEIGLIPNTEFAKEVVDIDDYGRIVIDPWTQQTSTQGIWAAGDCTNVRYHQNNIAAGDAIKALEDLYLWLHANKAV